MGNDVSYQNQNDKNQNLLSSNVLQDKEGLNMHRKDTEVVHDSKKTRI